MARQGHQAQGAAWGLLAPLCRSPAPLGTIEAAAQKEYRLKISISPSPAEEIVEFSTARFLVTLEPDVDYTIVVEPDLTAGEVPFEDDLALTAFVVSDPFVHGRRV